MSFYWQNHGFSVTTPAFGAVGNKTNYFVVSCALFLKTITTTIKHTDTYTSKHYYYKWIF